MKRVEYRCHDVYSPSGKLLGWRVTYFQRPELIRVTSAKLFSSVGEARTHAEEIAEKSGADYEYVEVD